MTSGEKKQSILTTLAVLKKTDTVLHHRDHGLLTRHRKRINDGIFLVKAHGNILNQNASAVDLRWLVSWFKRFAISVGDVAPVRVRRKKTKEGEIKMYYSNAEYTLLPAYFTWDQLYTEMHNYVEEIALRVREPIPSSEKIQSFYNKVRPFVPEEFQNDPLYDPPNDEDERRAKQI
ncbi:hypothetical protein F441_15785 [Phytophthora nicotianae CJ01A1]|uniref:Uncharacterized protein n=1 Tax=Phytophthora nicotianae CJ01A1 TaxID=1317063 RepID=W2WC84_PHYNI|nr:hypothetical protein F441_15785 [Phytophthora nicotianae CJ01A1]